MTVSGTYSDAPPLAYISTLIEGSHLNSGASGSIFPIATETCYGLPVILQYETQADCLNAPLTALEQALGGLLEDEDEDSPPTPYAIRQAVLLSEVASRLLSHKWVQPRLATDGYGGVRMSWIQGRQEIRAVVSGSPDRERYIYWEDQNGYGSVPNFTAITLFTYLDALIGEQKLPRP